MRRRIVALSAAIGLALSLAACGPSADDANRQAAEFCADHGGVHRVQYWPADWPYEADFAAECRDGSEYE